jgi:hypothetical protein
MSRRPRLAILAGFVVVLLATFWVCRLLGAGRLLGSDEAAAAREVGQRGVLSQVRALRDRRPAVQAELESYADRTLGASIEQVDGTLRARLNRLGESEGLRGLVVGTGASSARESPAKSVYGRSAEQRPLRDEVDFVTLAAWINGEGTAEQVFRLLQRIEAEPWLKRIGTVRLEVVRSDRRASEARIKLSLGLTTIFLPGREPRGSIVSGWKSEDFAALAPLTEESIFAMPAPPKQPAIQAAEAAPPEPVAPPVPAFAYGEWLLSGVASGPGGPEVWLVNRGSSERRVLNPGEALHEMVLSEAAGERAIFTIDGRRVEVAVGEPMRER